MTLLMKIRSISLVLALFCTTAVAAQDFKYHDDAEIRTHFSLETKLSRRWTVHLDQQYRFGSNISRLTRGSADLGLTYKINKNVKLLADYTYILSGKKEGYYATRHWFSGAVTLRGNIDRWRFVYRNLVQLRNGDMNSDEMYQTKIYDRNKLSVRYEINKRWTAYTAAEAYIPLNNPNVKGIDRTRNFFGVLFNTTRNQQLELYFMYQHEWQKGGWWENDIYRYLRRDFVYGIGYGIEI